MHKKNSASEKSQSEVKNPIVVCRQRPPVAIPHRKSPVVWQRLRSVGLSFLLSMARKENKDQRKQTEEERNRLWIDGLEVKFGIEKTPLPNSWKRDWEEASFCLSSTTKHWPPITDGKTQAARLAAQSVVGKLGSGGWPFLLPMAAEENKSQSKQAEDERVVRRFFPFLVRASQSAFD